MASAIFAAECATLQPCEGFRPGRSHMDTCSGFESRSFVFARAMCLRNVGMGPEIGGVERFTLARLDGGRHCGAAGSMFSRSISYRQSRDDDGRLSRRWARVRPDENHPFVSWSFIKPLHLV